MKLSIIIPQFNEREELIRPLLSSIETQIMVDLKQDIEVLIVNDGSDVRLSSEFLKSFKTLNITYFLLEKNLGPSGARNRGLEKATGDYVMFCDADDRFLTNHALFLIFNELDNTKPDILCCDFEEELLHEGKKVLIKHSLDFIFIHGKVFSRAFLFYNNLRFCEDLRINEDSYFNGLCQSMTENKRGLLLSLYVWCHNENSVSRKESFVIEDFHTIVDTSDKLVEELSRRKNKNTSSYAFQILLYVYFKLQTKLWFNTKHLNARRKTEKRLFTYIKKWQTLLNTVPEATKEQLYIQERNKVMVLGQGIERETFDSFINRIIAENKQEVLT